MKKAGIRNERIRKEAVFVLVTVFFVLSLWLFISENVMSQNEGKLTVDEEAFLVLEGQYLSEVRLLLEEKGFRNAGVMLNRISEEGGNRNYQIVLHHKNINKLSVKEQNMLISEIAGMGFGIQHCDFEVEILY